MIDPEIIRAIFSANLSFTAFLLAIIGIIVPIYVRASTDLKKRYSRLLKIFGADFMLSTFVTMSSFVSLLNIPISDSLISFPFYGRLIILIGFSLEMVLLTIGAIVFIAFIT